MKKNDKNEANDKEEESWALGFLALAGVIFVLFGIPILLFINAPTLLFFLLLLFPPLAKLNNAKPILRVCIIGYIIISCLSYISVPAGTFLINALVVFTWIIGDFVIGIAKNHP